MTEKLPHIGQFIDSMDPGGAEQLLIDLCAGLARRGCRVSLFHFGNPWILEHASTLNIEQVVLRNRSNYKSLYRLPFFLWQFRRLLGDHGIDLLHSHLLGAVFAGSIGARLAGIESVGTLHDTYSLDGSRKVDLMLGSARKCRTELVAISNDMLEAIGDRYRGGSVHLIYNGIDLSRFVSRQDAPDGRTRVVLTAVARFVEVKRLDILLEAASLVRAKADWELRIIGEGPLGRSLEDLAAELGIADRVRFPGFTKAIPAELANSDVFVLSSDSEGLSISIMESMAAGLPAVVTAVGGNAQLVLDGQTGFVVPRREPDKLAEALAALIDDEDLRTRLGANARARAEQHFDLDVMVDRYMSVYRAQLSRGERRV